MNLAQTVLVLQILLQKSSLNFLMKEFEHWQTSAQELSEKKDPKRKNYIHIYTYIYSEVMETIHRYTMKS